MPVEPASRRTVTVAAPRQRLPLIDLLKAVAAQLIVLHHLAFYGPMSDVAADLAPRLIEWLSRDARMAVQVFLVVGGFLAARQLAPLGRLRLRGSPWIAMRNRYLRLVLPYATMLVLVLCCAALARRWLAHDSVPGPASAWDVLAHLLLLQDLLDVDALSAGVWYVAIDFQLFGLLLGLSWLAARLERRLSLQRPLAPVLVTALVLASLLYFNREPGWDVAAPYFFGAYGLGVLAAWWIATAPADRRAWPWVVAAVGVVLALLLDWRPRIALASAVALALLLVVPRTTQLQGRWLAWVEGLARISYAQFLSHFGVCLLVNAVFARLLPATATVQGVGLLVAWGASVAVAVLFHRRVERPALRWAAERDAPAPLAAA